MAILFRIISNFEGGIINLVITRLRLVFSRDYGKPLDPRDDHTYINAVALKTKMI